MLTEHLFLPDRTFVRITSNIHQINLFPTGASTADFCQLFTTTEAAAKQLVSEQLASTASKTAGSRLVIMAGSWLEQLEQLVFVKPTGLHNNFTFSLWQKLYL